MNRKYLCYFFSFLLFLSEVFFISSYSLSSSFLRYTEQCTKLSFSGEIIKHHSYSHVSEQNTWNISTMTIIKNQTLLISKNIYIHNGGALILYNSVLRMNLSQIGEYKIEVFAGGNLTLIKSVITASNPSMRYYIRINRGAKFYMEQSEVSFAGYTLSGDLIMHIPGLWINTDNTTIIDSKLTHNEYGIWLEQSNNSCISNNIVSNNTQNGIYLVASNGCTIANNTISNNSAEGIRIEHSYYNLIVRNNIRNNIYGGVDILLSDNNTISNNTIISVNKEECISIWGSDNIFENNTLIGGGFFVAANKETLISTVFRNNTVNHKLFVFIINQTGTVVKQEAGQVLVAFSNNITIQNVKISNTSIGIIVINSTALAIINNDLANNERGIFLWMCNNSLIKSNNITDNYYGIYLRESTNTMIIENNIVSNQYGIFSWNSLNNTIENNTFRDNMVDVKDNLTEKTFLDVSVFLKVFSAVAMIFLIIAIIVKYSQEKAKVPNFKE